MIRVRQTAVAGSFYPADRDALDAVVRRMLGAAPAPSGPAPKALIVPHAGYEYSGQVAAAAYAQLRPWARQYRRVVLLGPCHHLPFTGLALSSADCFHTPLGDVPLDREAFAVQSHPAVEVLDAAHRLEHSLEVQLPFLQCVLNRFVLVPLVVGDANMHTVAAVIDSVWAGAETLIVVSSDLSHYLGYAAACRRDRETCRAIEALEPRAIGHAQACGATPLQGLLIAARRRGLRAVTLDLRNSGDTAGAKDRVVGYGAWMLLEDGFCEQAA